MVMQLKPHDSVPDVFQCLFTTIINHVCVAGEVQIKGIK